MRFLLCCAAVTLLCEGGALAQSLPLTGGTMSGPISWSSSTQGTGELNLYGHQFFNGGTTGGLLNLDYDYLDSGSLLARFGTTTLLGGYGGTGIGFNFYKYNYYQGYPLVANVPGALYSMESSSGDLLWSQAPGVTNARSPVALTERMRLVSATGGLTLRGQLSAPDVNAGALEAAGTATLSGPVVVNGTSTFSAPVSFAGAVAPTWNGSALLTANDLTSLPAPAVAVSATFPPTGNSGVFDENKGTWLMVPNGYSRIVGIAISLGYWSNPPPNSTVTVSLSSYGKGVFYTTTLPCTAAGGKSPLQWTLDATVFPVDPGDVLSWFINPSACGSGPRYPFTTSTPGSSNFGYAAFTLH